MTLPSSLFKFESFTAQALSNLKEQVIYFSSPRNFNDPYDCSIKTFIKEPSDDEMRNFKESKELLHMQPLPKIKESMTSGLLKAVERKKHDFLENKGVSCFSQSNRDLLMWAHYSDKYTGFCLEFDTSFEPFNLAKKVKYTNEPPKINPLDVLDNDDYDLLTDLYCIKPSSWKYEKEWRCFHHKANTAYHYEAGALKAVHFGPCMPQAHVEIIFLILKGQNPNVKCFQGHLDESEFKVNLEERVYVPHVEALAKGLYQYSKL
ncbi:TPA: DUF2971 domain-containing protein [Vibrio parahaemolyticus]